MTACLMAYNGWSYVSFVAGEVKDPQRNLPRSLALGMVARDGAVSFGEHRLHERDDSAADRRIGARGGGGGGAHYGPGRCAACSPRWFCFP